MSMGKRHLVNSMWYVITSRLGVHVMFAWLTSVDIHVFLLRCPEWVCVEKCLIAAKKFHLVCQTVSVSPCERMRSWHDTIVAMQSNSSFDLCVVVV